MLNTINVRRVNLFCLLAAIAFILWLPHKKQVGYDEKVSMVCSKGFTFDDPKRMSDFNIVSSSEIEKLNTAVNVFYATVTDNGNSFLYNIALHYFTLAFGNNLSVYILFSKLFGAAVLIVFYLLCNMLLENSIFTGLAVIMLVMDVDFTGMSHEIRAYIIGMFFVCASGVFFFRFINKGGAPVNLFFAALFSVSAILCHFLTVYIILVFCLAFMLIYGLHFFSVRNMMAIFFPIAIIALYFYFSSEGLLIMNKQNTRIQLRDRDLGFSFWYVLVGTLKFIALNFKVVLPAWIGKVPVIIGSFLGVIALYISAWKNTTDKLSRRNLHLLFALGASSSLFLAFLCIRSGHYTALYFRYHSFALPFSILFTAYALYLITRNANLNKKIKTGIVLAVFLPVCILFVNKMNKPLPKMQYNHVAVADLILKDKIRKIELPKWRDAYLIHCLLPRKYAIQYIRNDTTHFFTLYSDKGQNIQVPVINK